MYKYRPQSDTFQLKLEAKCDVWWFARLSSRQQLVFSDEGAFKIKVLYLASDFLL